MTHREPRDHTRGLPRRRRAPSLVVLRVAELRRLFVDRYGGWAAAFPDDDAGRGDLEILLHHLARLPGNPSFRLGETVSRWAPWLSVQEGEDLVVQVLRSPRRWKAATLGEELGLLSADRRRLKIRTIRAIDQKTKTAIEARRANHRESEHKRRRARGQRPRAEWLANSLSRIEPWKFESICRRTWERRRRAVARPWTM